MSARDDQSDAAHAARVLAHGIDVIEVQRIAEILLQHGDRFRARVFTAGERAQCAGDAREAARLAARFAAKEAALKALGTGLADGMTWHDVEVVTHDSGRPLLALHGRAAQKARALGLTQWSVSLSHTRTLASASVIATG